MSETATRCEKTKYSTWGVAPYRAKKYADSLAAIHADIDAKQKRREEDRDAMAEAFFASNRDELAERIDSHERDAYAEGRNDQSEDDAADITRLRRDNAALLAACQAAKRFIKNGIEFGRIQMPDADTVDSAHDTLPTLVAAIAQAQEK